MIDLDNLEAKAKAAVSANPGAGQWDCDQGRDELNAGGFIVADVWDESCGEFIVAANPATVLDLIRELREARAAVAAEREACAKVCDTIAFSYPGGERCAAVIRARSEKVSKTEGDDRGA